MTPIQPIHNRLPRLSNLQFPISIILTGLLLGSCTPSESLPVEETPPPVGSSSPNPEPSPLSLSDPDLEVQQQIQAYLNRLSGQGFDPQQQGIWLQTDDRLLAEIGGTVPLPAASLTKIATTLAALRQFDLDHRFSTQFFRRGEIKDGVLDGDLLVVGEMDPLFVWEEAIVIANQLTELGLREVTGDLIIVGDFFMNFEEDSVLSGELLKQALNARLWTGDAEAQYRTLPPETPRPQLEISGQVRQQLQPLSDRESELELLLAHQSQPLPRILKLMNRYSNNAIAHMLANAIGGPEVVRDTVIAATGIPPQEIRLINGSGLGRENQMSPRTVIRMYQAIQQELAPQGLTLADVVAVAGEPEGILTVRPLPPYAVLKSGSLNAVSTLSGALPTQDKGIIWFSLLHGGGDIEILRAEQERFLRELETQWGAVDELPAVLTIQLPEG
ncbi:D-alanyl-D-alanine carboxypeptidase [Phormidium yuhuli AB48]|uniref:D-alanyl-D-alanine carboxypeptidase n=1 Tax=Phormidium yuhuli AB48 TaxID=2940671 RepID=A0ABY5AMS0_9CYAN|nr:D-alanyl-D-alanine carboxypeptidase [Phormidium yuhuli]USR90484.1 D-alanyl-D-alanine carboxypeptidase [Phormidium yuhuli AB48]